MGLLKVVTSLNILFFSKVSHVLWASLELALQPRMTDASASTSQVLGLWGCTTMSGLCCTEDQTQGFVNTKQAL